MKETKDKNWVAYENDRNRVHADLYTRIMKLAFGADQNILCGHHLAFEKGADLATENEIPAADTLLFDHDIMGAVFGVHANHIMRELATAPCGRRDDLAKKYLNLYHPVSK